MQKAPNADMAELADAPDLGSGGKSRAGSTPVIRTFLFTVFSQGGFFMPKNP